MGKIITDFIDVIQIKEEKRNGYLTIMLLNPFTGKKYLFRVAGDLWKLAWDNKIEVDGTAILHNQENKYNDDVA